MNSAADNYIRSLSLTKGHVFIQAQDFLENGTDFFRALLLANPIFLTFNSMNLLSIGIFQGPGLPGV